MQTALFLLILGAVIVSLWMDGARAREFATVLARRHCDRQGLQFLDETVAMVRFGVRWTQRGLRIRRMYRFDFSLEGAGRRYGYLIMLGSYLELIDDGLPTGEPDTATDDQPIATGDDNVVPFRRNGRDRQ